MNAPDELAGWSHPWRCARCGLVGSHRYLGDRRWRCEGCGEVKS